MIVCKDQSHRQVKKERNLQAKIDSHDLVEFRGLWAEPTKIAAIAGAVPTTDDSIVSWFPPNAGNPP
jgi:hypothetical protein